LERSDAESLKQAILEAVLTNDAYEQNTTNYGRRFVVDFELERGVGMVLYKAMVRTSWIIKNDQDFPRLTTCLIREGVFSHGRHQIT
jgi:hypothetical protein